MLRNLLVLGTTLVPLFAVIAACTPEPLIEVNRFDADDDAVPYDDSDEPDVPNDDTDPPVSPVDPEEPIDPDDPTDPTEPTDPTDEDPTAILPLESCDFAGMVRADAPSFDEALVNAALDELTVLCDLSSETTTAPNLVPPAPEANALPPECDEQARIDAIVERCGPMEDVASLDEADCAGRTCHVVLGAGTFNAPANLSCAFVEGTGGTSLIVGASSVADVVVARIRWDGDYAALDVFGDVMVNEAHISADYDAVSSSWDADYDIAVCRSRIRAGYGGVTQSWESSRITLAGNAISACYETAASAWGSRDLVVEQNILISGWSGVSIHESSCSAVVDNVLASNFSVVSTTIWPICDPETMGDCSFDPPTQRVLVEGNVVVRGELPETMVEREIFVNQ